MDDIFIFIQKFQFREEYEVETKKILLKKIFLYPLIPYSKTRSSPYLSHQRRFDPLGISNHETILFNSTIKE